MEEKSEKEVLGACHRMTEFARLLLCKLHYLDRCVGELGVQIYFLSWAVQFLIWVSAI